MIDFNKSGYFSRLKETDNKDHKEISPLLVTGETIEATYKTTRDYVFFTTHRIIAMNVQGLTRSKKDITSIPYSKIQTFSVETSGTFDLDSELGVYVSSVGHIKFSFSGKADMVKIAHLISQYALR